MDGASPGAKGSTAEAGLSPRMRKPNHLDGGGACSVGVCCVGAGVPPCADLSHGERLPKVPGPSAAAMDVMPTARASPMRTGTPRVGIVPMEVSPRISANVYFEMEHSPCNEDKTYLTSDHFNGGGPDVTSPSGMVRPYLSKVSFWDNPRRSTLSERLRL